MKHMKHGSHKAHSLGKSPKGAGVRAIKKWEEHQWKIRMGLIPDDNE